MPGHVVSPADLVLAGWPDFRRIFFGDESASFLVEIVFRTAWLYGFAYVLVRALGPRMTSQVSPVELFVVIALGSAVGDGMFYPDVPLLHSMVVVAVVVALTRVFGEAAARSERFETLLEGAPSRLIDAGCIDGPGLERAQLTLEGLFQLLRAERIEHLGEVRVAYLEQSGHVSVFRFREGDEIPGLAIEPPFDLLDADEHEAGTRVLVGGWFACLHCGAARRFEAGEPFEAHEGHKAAWTDRVGGVASGGEQEEAGG